VVSSQHHIRTPSVLELLQSSVMHNASNLKRRLREHGESAEARAVRLANKRQCRQSGSGGAGGIRVENSSELTEIVEENRRTNRVEQTRSRNKINQEAIALKEMKECKSSRRLTGIENGKASVDDEKRFFDKIDEVLTVVCGSSGELVAPKVATKMDMLLDSNDLRPLYKDGVTGEQKCGIIPEGVVATSSSRVVLICARCRSALRRKEAPKYSAASGFIIGVVPVELARLSWTESWRIGLGTCFTTCFNLARGGQECTRGNAVNCWNKVCDVVTSLPRPLTMSGVIQLVTDKTDSHHESLSCDPTISVLPFCGSGQTTHCNRRLKSTNTSYGESWATTSTDAWTTASRSRAKCPTTLSFSPTKRSSASRSAAILRLRSRATVSCMPGVSTAMHCYHPCLFPNLLSNIIIGIDRQLARPWRRSRRGLSQYGSDPDARRVFKRYYETRSVFSAGQY
jgi:hypothetical protein